MLPRASLPLIDGHDGKRWSWSRTVHAVGIERTEFEAGTLSLTG
jgi:hypothetical protein